jgi:hypothetical protein
LSLREKGSGESRRDAEGAAEEGSKEERLKVSWEPQRGEEVPEGDRTLTIEEW